jgi:uncharacterized protein (TIGR03086 family)
MRGRQQLAEDGVVRPRPNDTITNLIQRGRDREAAELALRTRGDHMDPITQLDHVLPMLDRLIAGLDGDDLARPTPCASFDVRGVLAHMVGGATMFAAAFRGEPADAPALDDVVAEFPTAMAALRAAVASPGALERTSAGPFGDVTGGVFARFVAVDGLVHGWDIATATGQPYDPPADLVAAADAFAREAIGDGMRDGDTFAAATMAPAGASPIEELVAFTGRTVA